VIRIRPLAPADATRCDAIVASLPDWFGDPTGLRECHVAVRTQPGYVAEIDAEPVGFLTVTRPREAAAEISWMAVHAGRRGLGCGRALVDALLADLRADGAAFLLVKTLSDLHPDPGYAQTRAFYRAVGFVPVMDLDIWGPENPALLLVRAI